MSQLTRREFTLLSAAAGLSSLMPSFAFAAEANWPAKDITFVIPYAAGGGYDTLVRRISPVMQKYLPRRVNIVPLNMAASGGGRALTSLYRERPDGYTIGLFGVPGMFLLQQQQIGAGIDPNRFTWLGQLGPSEHYGIAVEAKSPLKSVADLRAAGARAPVTFASTGPDGTGYLTTIIATKVLGIESKIITGYRGSNDYMVAMLRGDSQAVIAPIPILRPYVQRGLARIVASFEPKSTVAGVPDATALGKPELSKVVIDRLVAAPPGLPVGIKTALQTALEKAVRDPEVVAWAKDVGTDWDIPPAGQAEQVLREQAALFQTWKQYLPAPGPQ
jgi:tripartite-type tricarboxylate transporter receptor subunit TctC